MEYSSSLCGYAGSRQGRVARKEAPDLEVGIDGPTGGAFEVGHRGTGARARPAMTASLDDDRHDCAAARAAAVVIQQRARAVGRRWGGLHLGMPRAAAIAVGEDIDALRHRQDTPRVAGEGD